MPLFTVRMDGVAPRVALNVRVVALLLGFQVKLPKPLVPLPRLRVWFALLV
jgi:hypothetical protein